MTTAGRAAFASRDFRLHQSARFLSTLGTQMQSVAIAWQVYAIAKDPMALALVGLAQFIPALSLSLVTGHIADRFDRRRIVVVCQLAYAASALALLAIARAGITSPLPIYAVLLFFGTARAFAGPATHALLPALVPPDHLANALAWSSSIWQVASIAGPAVGGFVYAGFDASGVYAVSTVLTLSAAVLTSALRARRAPGAKAPADANALFAGIRYVWREKVVLGAMSLDLFAVLFGGAVALLPAFAQDILHVGPAELGLLRSAPAIGGVVTALLLAHRPLGGRTGRTMLLCVALFGVATIAFGLSRSFALSLVALFAIGAFDMVSVVIRGVLVQGRTPEEMRGRVSAVNLVFVGASNELGEFESGLTAAWLGLVPAVVLGGVGTILVVAVGWFAFPALRKVDRLHPSLE